jgi:hypothetical protein
MHTRGGAGITRHRRVVGQLAFPSTLISSNNQKAFPSAGSIDETAGPLGGILVGATQERRV